MGNEYPLIAKYGPSWNVTFGLLRFAAATVGNAE